MAGLPGRRFLTLKEALGRIPDSEEGIWEHVGQVDFDSVLFRVVEVDPREVVDWFTWDGVTTVREAYRNHAEPWQRKLVKHYSSSKGLKEAKSSFLVVDLDEEELVDGHHRAIALARKGVRSVRALDLSDEWDWRGGCILCGGPTDDYECGECKKRNPPSMDERIRRLERRVASGDSGACAELAKEHARVGTEGMYWVDVHLKVDGPATLEDLASRAGLAELVAIRVMLHLESVTGVGAPDWFLPAVRDALEDSVTGFDFLDFERE